MLFSVVALGTSLAAAQGPALVPMPSHVEPAAGTLSIRNRDVISYPVGDEAARFTAQHLAGLLETTCGLHLVAAPAAAQRHAAIVIEHTATGTGKEGYDLTVTPQGARIAASTAAGLYYGSVTLWQWMTPPGQQAVPASIPSVTIHDAPELPWRGIMLDSARHMQSLEYIRQLIDWMSLEKLNTLHWHLTDDQGWRIEIKRYPKLTSVGGFRQLPQVFGTSGSTLTLGPRYGGFYTQAQARELVKYAADRNVMIVPEIEMPGHASAALAAYPEFGSTEDHLTGPASEHGIFPYLYNIDDKTFDFIQNVLTEVMDIFPSPFIHVGGDEAIKDQWKASATIQAQMKKLGIANEDALQSYFIKRIDTFLTAHHRRTLGWDEILEGGLAPNAAVMSWHGIAGGIMAAKQGHDAVLTPTRPLYFNYRQTESANESPGRFALNTLENVYRFDPLPPTLTPEERKHILGVQASLWSEYMPTEDRITWMIFPRAAALAEIGWEPTKPREWKDFTTRVAAEMYRYQKLGLKYDPNVFSVISHETLKQNGSAVEIALSNQAGVGAIHYTLDGSPVGPSSPLYREPVQAPLPSRLQAATFIEGEVPGGLLDRALNPVTVRTRLSQDLQLCVNDPSIAMEQDPPRSERPVVLANYKNTCWIYKNADLHGVKSISVGVMALPYLFRDKNRQPPPTGESHTASGEVEVHLNACTGTLLATVPLQPAVGHLGVTTLAAKLPPAEDAHDLCLKIVRPTVTPLWVLHDVSLQ